MRKPREITNKIYEAVDEGLLSWEQIAEAAMRFMSEDDVAKMAHNEEFFLHEQQEDEDEDEDEEDTEYLDEDELADVFDEYCAENGITLSPFWDAQCMDQGINEFADEIAANQFTTIRECIAHFCKEGS
jgi:uncharacterized damage-inducible protein DinB